MGETHSAQRDGAAQRDVPYNALQLAESGTPTAVTPTASLLRKEDVIVTKLRRDHWMVGAQILACIHDMIHFRGPYYFTNACVYGRMLEDKVNMLDDEDAATVFQTLMRYFMTVVFCILIPFFSPVLVAKFMVHFSWGYEKHGDTFTLGNLVLNSTRIIEVAHQNQLTGRSDDVTDVGMLVRQRFQKSMSAEVMQYVMGCTTLGLLALFILLHHLSKYNKVLKRIFVFKVLHFLWISPDYPLLQYTSGEIQIFSGKCTLKLFMLVPCAWLATVTSFVVVLPVYSVYLDGDIFLLRKVLPSACVAAFAFGKIYMQLANATFVLWLSTEKDYALVQRQFTLNPVFTGLQMHQDMFTVTVEEIEALASNALMHEALLIAAKIPMDLQEKVRNENTIGSHKVDADAWQQMQDALLTHCMQKWVLRVIFVKDVSAGAGASYSTLELTT